MPHINVFGGEERFWIGPEGGQFSIFFPPGGKFELADWQTPAAIDTEPFQVVDKKRFVRQFPPRTRSSRTIRTPSSTSASSGRSSCSRRATPRSRSAEVQRSADSWATGRLSLDESAHQYRHRSRWQQADRAALDLDPRHVQAGPADHGRDPLSDRATKTELGPIVNDAYFGKPPAERFKIGDGVLFFSGDGKFRSKIGLSPQRARDVAGSWDAAAGVLTIVKYTQPAAGVTDYVNSMWEIQQQPVWRRRRERLQRRPAVARSDAAWAVLRTRNLEPGAGTRGRQIGRARRGDVPLRGRSDGARRTGEKSARGVARRDRKFAYEIVFGLNDSARPFDVRKIEKWR